MKVKTIAKRVFAAVLAASLTLTGALALAPASVSEAADALEKPVLTTPKITVESDGKVYIRFSWNYIMDADKYECQICYNYTKDSTVANFTPLRMTEEIYTMVEVPEEFNSIAIKVASRKGFSQTSGFTDPVVVDGKKIAPYVNAQKNYLAAQSGKTKKLVAKAKELAKKDKKKGVKHFYGLQDINGDGVSELFFVHRKNGKDEVSIYRLKGKKVELVKTSDGAKALKNVKEVYVKGKTVSFVMKTSSKAGSIYTYKLNKKGKLVATAKYGYNKNKYTKNGGKSSKKAYEKNEKKVKKQTGILYDYTKL